MTDVPARLASALDDRYRIERELVQGSEYPTAKTRRARPTRE